MLLLAATLLAGLVAQAAPIALQPAPGGGIGFDLDSSAGPVRGRADLYTAALDPETGTGLLVVEAGALTTAFGPRDQRMLIYALDVVAFPSIRFELDGIEGSVEELGAGTGSGALRLRGRLTIRDVTTEVVVGSTFAWEGPKLRLQGEHWLRWASFGVPDPSVLVAQVGEQVRVHFDLIGSTE